MSKEELKEYIGIVVDMEKECYLQNTLLYEMQNQIYSLQNTSSIRQIEEPTIEKSNNNKMDFAILGLILGGIAGAILGRFFWIILVLPFDSIYCMIAGAILLGIIGIFVFTHLHSKGEQKSKSEYENQKKAYDLEIEQEQKRVQSENNIITYLQQEVSTLNKQIVHSNNCLKAIYDKNIIFPKYRNFVMMSAIYEYFCSGRCETLEGHEGAYNILENEIRLDRIIIQLDNVINQLEQIRNNQYMIYDAIQESNRTLNEILESNNQVINKLRNIEGQGNELNSRIADLQINSRLNNYYNELNQKEVNYMNRMGLQYK